MKRLQQIWAAGLCAAAAMATPAVEAAACRQAGFDLPARGKR